MSTVETILIRTTDAATQLGISKATLHRWVKAGKIECVYVERNSIYFTQEQIDDFIARQSKRYQPAYIQENAE